MTLPLLISVPHCGVRIPDEVADLCILTEREIIADGDEGAWEVYAPLRDRVAAFVQADVARAIVDLNRDVDDRRKDGIVKTHTCWDVPVYRDALPENVVERLLRAYYRPYHQRLTELAAGPYIAGIDCHTMAAVGPPVAPDSGEERPAVCIGTGAGAFPKPWTERLLACFRQQFPGRVTVDDPFSGGFITRAHGREMPWVQIELSRGDFMSNAEKSTAVVAALGAWVADLELAR